MFKIINTIEAIPGKYFKEFSAATVWLTSVIVSGIWFFEGEGMYGPFMQYAIATLLLVIACCDLVISEGWAKVKGFILFSIGAVYLLPPMAAVNPSLVEFIPSLAEYITTTKCSN